MNVKRRVFSTSISDILFREIFLVVELSKMFLILLIESHVILTFL